MTTEGRVAALERRANRYRNALVVLLLALCAVAVMGATGDDEELSAKRLWIMNNEGKAVIGLHATDAGHGLITLHNGDTDSALVYLGSNDGGDGLLTVSSKTGTDLINAGGAARSFRVVDA